MLVFDGILLEGQGVQLGQVFMVVSIVKKMRTPWVSVHGMAVRSAMWAHRCTLAASAMINSTKIRRMLERIQSTKVEAPRVQSTCVVRKTTRVTTGARNTGRVLAEPIGRIVAIKVYGRCFLWATIVANIMTSWPTWRGMHFVLVQSLGVCSLSNNMGQKSQLWTLSNKYFARKKFRVILKGIKKLQ